MPWHQIKSKVARFFAQPCCPSIYAVIDGRGGKLLQHYDFHNWSAIGDKPLYVLPTFATVYTLRLKEPHKVQRWRTDGTCETIREEDTAQLYGGMGYFTTQNGDHYFTLYAVDAISGDLFEYNLSSYRAGLRH